VTYRRGMDLKSWVNEHAGEDVIVRCALDNSEFDAEGNDVRDQPDFDRLHQEAGRLIGLVDGLLYLDRPAGPTSLPLPDVIRAIKDFKAHTGAPPWPGVMAGEGGTAATHYVDPAVVLEIDVDHGGVSRRAEGEHREVERDLQSLNHVVDTQPCYLCGRMVQPGEEPYDILGPESGLGEEGDPDGIPGDRTWKVICSRHA
jgi:hypothetical protein